MAIGRALVTDSLGEAGLERLREAGVELEVALDLDEAALRARIADKHALIVRSRTQVTAGVIDAARVLTFIVRAGTGIDNIALGAATARRIPVANTPGANSNAAAEHTLALLF